MRNQAQRVRGRGAELAARAAALGHVPSVEHRPAAQDGWHEKYWATCSCGYRSTRRATKAEAFSTAIWHLCQVLDDDTLVDGGVPHSAARGL